MMNKIKTSLLLATLLFSQLASANLGYFRSPDINKDTVVFTAEGDIWLSSLKNKNAVRLTTNPAIESQAHLSNNGKSIAFAANYEGATEIYIMPTAGGVAKRVTFENSSVRIQGWTQSGNILYSTNTRIGPSGNWTLKIVNPKTFALQEIELADAVEGAIDSKNKYIYFVQFGLQVTGDNNQVYRGGAKGELWRYRLDSDEEAELLSKTHQGSIRSPMVTAKKIYFISDLSGNDNIWSMNLNGQNQRQITHFKDFPIRSANINKQQIIFQQGADLHVLNVKSKKVKHLDIALRSDFSQLREHWINKPLKYLNSANYSSKNNKVVITARGKIALSTTKKQRLVEIDVKPNSRSRNAILSKDGKWVYAINDSSGELEIWQYSSDGSQSSKQLTHDSKIFRWNLHLSPDGEWIAHDDKLGNLWLLNTKTAENTKILSQNAGGSPFADIVWSADSKLLAITRNRQKDERSRIMLFSIDDKKQQLLTSDKYNSYSPAFSPDGAWLYFLSERYFRASPTSPWGDRNMGTMFDRRSQIFAFDLKNTGKFPFKREDELSAKEKSKKDKNKSDGKTKSTDEKKSEDKKDDETKDVVADIKWDGLSERLWQVPVSSGNYRSLKVNTGFLYVIDRINEPKSKATLKSIKIKPDTKATTFVVGIANYQLSLNGKKMFVRKRGNDNSSMYIVSAGERFPKDVKNAQLNTRDWQMLINPQQEWQQIFHDTWLMHRDSFYDKNMRGVDWNNALTKYKPLLDRITDRSELNDIFKQMIGELNALHSHVYGGDYKIDKEKSKASSLGAQYKQTKQGVMIEHIFEYEKELPSQAGPLAKVSVNAKEGDIIKSINGKKIDSIAQLNHKLLNQAGKQTLISLLRGDKTIKSIVMPMSNRNDRYLRYNDWVTNNKNKVLKENNNIGYLHLSAMGARDIANFAREFYANYKKEGLIIDVRRNNGGNIDSWILEKLLRKAWMFWDPRVGAPSSNMQQAFRGHLVVLADQLTYSDGETFTAGIKALNLAPVIGKQTAGAGVWLTGRNRVVDHGLSRVAEFPQFAMDGRWIVEGHGVEPTIEVDNLPHETFSGKDAQLSKAIQYLSEQMATKPVDPLQAKPLPTKGKAQDVILH